MFKPTLIPFADCTPAALSLYFYYADGSCRRIGNVATARVHEVASRVFQRQRAHGVDVVSWRAFIPGAGEFAYGSR